MPHRSSRVLLALVAALLAGACRRPPALEQVVIAVPYGPTELWSHTSADEVTNSILRSAYEPLVDLSADLRLLPCLAASWHNPDDVTWEFRLRGGVNRHDGAPLRAADVAAFFRRVLEDPRTLRSPGHLLEAVEAVDDETLRLRTRRPVGWLPSQLARLLVAVDVPGQPVPLGTGPYRVARWTPGGETEMVAVGGHRDGEPEVARVRFLPIPEPAEAVRRLAAGEVHLLPEPAAEAWDALRANKALRTYERPSLRVLFLGINSLPDTGRAELRDVRVRRGLRRALDPVALLAAARPAPGVPARELVPPDLVGAHGNLPLDPPDVDAARASLASAGVRPGLALSLDYEARRYPAIEQLAEGVAAQLARAGLRVRPRPRPPGSRLQREGLELFLLGWLHSSGDAASSYEYLVHSPTSLGRGGLSGYSNPVLDRLLAETALPVGGEARQRLLREVAEIIHTDVALIPLYRSFDRYAFDARLDFTPRLDRRIRGQDLRPAP